MEILTSAWMYFWFQQSSPVDLGVSRAVFFGLMFLYFFNFTFKEWAKVSPVFWRPHTFFRLLGVPVLRCRTLFALEVIWKALLLLACLGFATRVTVAGCFLIGIYLVGLPNCFGKIKHGYGLPIIIMGILTFSKCGDSFSLDQLLLSNWQPAASANRSADYTWPLGMIWLVIALALCAAGCSKIKKSGFAWVRGENLSTIFRGSHYWAGANDPAVNWGLWIAERPALCWFLGISTLVLELGYPLALFWPEGRWFFVGGGFLMLLSFRALMGMSFVLFAICQLFWIPWERLWAMI